MSFTNTTLQDSPDLGAGEVITASPYNVSAFELFEDGLIEAASASSMVAKSTISTHLTPQLSRVS